MSITLNYARRETSNVVAVNVSEKLSAAGITAELEGFRRGLMITDGRLTRLTRKVVALAYQERTPELIDAYVSFMKQFKMAKFAAAVKAALVSVAFVEFNDNGKAVINRYDRKSKAEKALADKAFGVLSNYEQAQQALARQRALERKESVVSLEKLNAPKGAIGDLSEQLKKLYDKASGALERARAMPEQNKNKKACIAFLEQQTAAFNTLSTLLSKMQGMNAKDFAAFNKALKELNS